MALSTAKPSIKDFLLQEFNGKRIRIRDIDGYVNASDMCKTQKKGKLSADYFRNIDSEKFISELSSHTGISKCDLVQKNKGGAMKGTYIHPRLATHFAQWVSVEFAVIVSGWIEEWKTHHTDNQKQWEYELNNLKLSESNQKEKEIQLKLKGDLNAEIEVKTDFGYIDLLTKTDIIEIKIASKWKNALGQILAYGEYYPNHKKWIYLFDDEKDDKVITFCSKFNVEVLYI
jgi:hypothetical protein